MTIASSKKTEGPASVGALCQAEVQSQASQKDLKMNRTEHSTGAAATPAPDHSDNVASTEEWAAIEFEPWPVPAWTPPTNAEWGRLANPFASTISVAWHMVQKSKPSLMEMVDGLDDETGRGLMTGFTDTISFFEAMIELLKAAETRFLVAGAAVLIRDAMNGETSA